MIPLKSADQGDCLFHEIDSSWHRKEIAIWTRWWSRICKVPVSFLNLPNSVLLSASLWVDWTHWEQLHSDGSWISSLSRSSSFLVKLRVVALYSPCLLVLTHSDSSHESHEISFSLNSLFILVLRSESVSTSSSDTRLTRAQTIWNSRECPAVTVDFAMALVRLSIRSLQSTS